MASIIVHATMWNSREETEDCHQQLPLHDLVHKFDLAALLRWNKTAKYARISDKLTRQPPLNILTRLGAAELCTASWICGLAQRFFCMKPVSGSLHICMLGFMYLLPECSLKALTLRCTNKSHTWINAHASKMHVLPHGLYLACDVISFHLPLPNPLTPWVKCIITISVCFSYLASRSSVPSWILCGRLSLSSSACTWSLSQQWASLSLSLRECACQSQVQ